jgi:DNA (cytosine-5)-methyltransferase 1
VLDLAEPLGTQVAGGGKAALVAAFMAKHFGGVVGSDLREPVATITTGGQFGVSQQAVMAATLGRLRGADIDGQPIDHPLPTQTSGGGHEMLILPFLQTYYGSGDNNHDVRDPLHTVTVGDRHGLVTVEVDGQTMVITDILMRMLDWSEGARAHGFDPDSLRHEIEVVDSRGRTIRRKPTKTECGHLVGNSVPPHMVELLAECNATPELMVAAE